jgi:methyl acetate hydrolase
MEALSSPAREPSNCSQVLDGFDPAGKLLLRPAKRPISLHDLLTHTAGFVYRLWHSEALKYYKAIDKLPTAERSRLPRTPLMFDPGERWQYGGNIDWVGRIVQAVSGEPLDAHFRKHIFEPPGMNDTGFVISPEQWEREASGHRRQSDGR